ncbi:MAG: glycosyltransferase [Treponema sp.]|jgi:glycosyltransferase involved in cell wall biosynthesis|nr:glycosyltransferase [Treponema sp.]
MDEPLISIIMSVRNGADTIKQTIESVLSQTYRNWTLSIRDNCSTDGTVEIINSFGDPRINLIVNESDKGSTFNQLLLVEAVEGEYIKLIDDDSYLYPECLRKQAQILLTRPEIAVVTCGTEYRTPGGGIIPVSIPFKNDTITKDDYIKYTLMTARGSVQEGNQLLTRTDAQRFATGRIMGLGYASGLCNGYSGYFYVTAAVLTRGDMYVVRETLSAGMIEAGSYSLKINQAKLMPAWIKLLRLEGYKITPPLYIWARIMIFARSYARRFVFWFLGRKKKQAA